MLIIHLYKNCYVNAKKIIPLCLYVLIHNKPNEIGCDMNMTMHLIPWCYATVEKGFKGKINMRLIRIKIHNLFRCFTTVKLDKHVSITHTQ